MARVGAGTSCRRAVHAATNSTPGEPPPHPMIGGYLTLSLTLLHTAWTTAHSHSGRGRILESLAFLVGSHAVQCSPQLAP